METQIKNYKLTIYLCGHQVDFLFNEDKTSTRWPLKRFFFGQANHVVSCERDKGLALG
jgi:hypothetical protein